MALNLPAVAPFDVLSDSANVGVRWQKWLSSFKLYLAASGVREDARKRALLLHLSGAEVQDIFFTLDDAGNDDSYEAAVNKLNAYFTPQKNIPYERHVFRQAEQSQGESMDSFVSRLKKLAATCEFGDNRDDFIRDQVIDKCTSNTLRRRLLREKDLKLAGLLEIARTMETADQQAARMEKLTVNAVERKSYKKADQMSKPKMPTTQRQEGGEHRIKCFRCGRSGHLSRECTITKNKKCNNCGKEGHFAKMCKTKMTHKVNRVVTIETQREHSDSEEDHVFTIKDCDAEGTLTVLINEQPVKMLIDSGASCNIVTECIFQLLKSKSNIELQNPVKKVYPFGSKKALHVKGVFSATFRANEMSEAVTALIQVVQEAQICVLGRQTAMKLGLLHIGPFEQVNSVQQKDVAIFTSEFEHKYKDCFQGLGKLKDFQLKLHIDKSVQPVAQPVRRVPFSLRKQVEEKLKQLEDADVIERVNGPTPWVSPLVVVHGKKEPRLCVDMRRANEAIIRERHPIPIIDEILENMTGATMFSKLDLKWGYHQIELEPESRSITTFVTHTGLWRYKRLMFGISSAPEIYQHIIGQVLQGIPGVHNISDDIIVSGETMQQHDERLHQVLQRLKENHLTVNRKKCQFQMTQLEFMGHVLSKNGIGAAQSKIEAVENTRRPTNAAEVRSFLGLVNYCGRFIPDLATTSEPLRKLTRQSYKWTWGSEQESAFVELKRQLTSSHVMAYFRQEAETHVIVDASPVGLGAILSQQQRDGTFRPVYYASRALSDVERRYSQTEKEALAIVWACEKFHVFLYGKDFVLVTDHKPLETIYSPKSKPPARIERWALRLQPYSFKVLYKPGPQNSADSLSRLTVNQPVQRGTMEDHVYWVAHHAVPHAFTPQQMEDLSAADPTLNIVRSCIETGDWKKCDPAYQTVKTELCTVGKIVMRGSRIVIPLAAQRQTLMLAHEGHQGIVKTKQRLRTKVWWPGIDREVEDLVRSCHACQINTSTSHDVPTVRTELPAKPWQMLAMDMCGPFPSGHYLLVVTDYYSRWVSADILQNPTSMNITNCMKHLFATHGLPESIVTDNGTPFISKEFKLYLQENGISHRRITPYWPQANGEVERQNKTLCKAIRAAHAEGKDWRAELDVFLLAYRSTPHCVTGRSPAELLFNRKIRTKLPELSHLQQIPMTDDAAVRRTDALRKEKGRSDADKHRKAKESPVKQGDRVLLRQQKQNKLSTPFEPEPYTVISRKGPSVWLEKDGKKKMRHVSHVKLWIEPEQDTSVLYDGAEPITSMPDPPQQQEGRPQRVKKAPTHLKDFVT
uniref:Gypsy retrotransposon integrase-like protein 1 n=1 Tax=Oryzias latipes TaxID=8090 RepID=A0A3P9MCB8_ORYLA